MKQTEPLIAQVSNTDQIAIEFEDAIFVFTEYGDSAGFLIARKFAICEGEGGIELESVLFLRGDGLEFESPPRSGTDVRKKRAMDGYRDNRATVDSLSFS